MPTNSLAWINRFPALSIKIYRSESAFELSALPPVLAEIDGAAVSYDDATAVFSTRYWYAVGAVVSASPLVERVCLPVSILTPDEPPLGVYGRYIPSGTTGYLVDGQAYRVIIPT